MDQELLYSILSEQFGYSSFRPNQFEIISDIISGKDCIALLPTGGGKSICYQLPVMYLRSKCLVISPLIALMNDQVDRLRKKSVPAYCIHSGQSSGKQYKAIEDYLSGEFGILYVSPERLKSENFYTIIQDINLSHIAIDEAHCISQWGHDFRPSYLNIDEFIGKMKIRPQIAAFTATATQNTISDILKYGGLKDPLIHKSPIKRSNIEISINMSASVDAMVNNYIRKNEEGSQIIYSRSRRKVKELSDRLNRVGHQSRYYHGNLPAEIRNKISDEWGRGYTKIMVATNAFGMGIDKEDVRSVYHLDIPPSIEEYFQEIGRAGRDGLPAKAIMLMETNGIVKTRENLSKEIISRSDWVKFKTGLLFQFSLHSDSIISPFLVKDFAKEINLHPFQIIRCLKLWSQSGDIYVSEGVYEASRVMLNAPKVKNHEFYKSSILKHKIVDYLLKNYEYLFDHHAVIVEEKLSEALHQPLMKIEKSLEELDAEGILSYQKRKSAPLIKMIFKTEDDQISYEFISYIQNAKIKKHNDVIDFLESDICRMRYLAEYFGDNDQVCGVCDNCKRFSEDQDSVNRFVNHVKRMGHNQSIDLRKAMLDFSANDRQKIVDQLRFLENEGNIIIRNGMIIGNSNNK